MRSSFLFLALALAACRTPTEITLDVRTDIGCGHDTVQPFSVLLNRGTMMFDQNVRVSNTGPPLPSPITLVMDALATGQVGNSTGITLAALPAGSPYIDLDAGLPKAGELTFLLKYTNVDASVFTPVFTPRVLAGPGRR